MTNTLIITWRERFCKLLLKGWLKALEIFMGSGIQVPFFSIITVSYQAAKTIGRTAKSLLGYDASMVEWLVIDGGSTDGTLEVLASAEKMPDLLVSEADKGLYDAMNKGVLLAKGSYLLFLNSDDWLEPEVLHAVKSAIENNPGYDVYHGHLYAHFTEGVVLQQAHGLWPTSMPAFQPASFLRRDLNFAPPWFDLKYKIASDFKFFKQLDRQGFRFFQLHQVVTNYTTDGISSNNRLRMAELEQILIELGYSRWLVWLFMQRMRLSIKR